MMLVWQKSSNFTHKNKVMCIHMENKMTKSGLLPEHFSKQIEGENISICTLVNKQGAEVVVTNYGAKVVSLMVPDKEGRLTDVVLGHASIDDYLSSGEPTFGATCGRYANRIAKGHFVLDGVAYELPINNGPNSLHGGVRGFHFHAWKMEQLDAQSVRLTYTAADGEEGYPGELKATVTYHWSDANELSISYEAVTTKPTVVNLTNHSYFNLSGEGDRYIGDHTLIIYADSYLPTDETAIPYGPAEPVEGTPMDFRTPHEIGERINQKEFQQIVYGEGYDHCYVLNKKEGEMALAARARSPKTGIVMETYTDQPGVQLYTANWLNESVIGKNGHPYPERCSFCLETQHFPDSPNKPEYPSTVLRPGETFRSETIYKFTVE